MKDASTTASKPVVERGYRRTPPRGAGPGIYPLRAAIYLRVSTLGQVRTNRDGEGFSIPAQREACLRRVEELGATFIAEYIDAGESARSADRPQLQELLERLRTERDIDIVVVHKIDRLARNREDDVNINLAIKKAGARLVSVTETIDDTPNGMLMHGIMSTLAEYYSRNLATEIVKGMEQKVKKGGMTGMAPIGYKNVQYFDGESTKPRRTVETDSERAPLVTWAFEAYASGDYTVRQLAEALAEKGLRTKGTKHRPSQALRPQEVHKLLQNRSYVGLVRWKGEEFRGSHEPLVSIETFARVQSILHSRAQSREKPSKHTHYLRGTLFCKRCGSSMGFVRAKGRSDYYDYFFCWSRHKRTGCDLPYVSAEILESQVEACYEPLQVSGQMLLEVRDNVLNQMKSYLEGAEKSADKARRQITKLDAERRSLLQAHPAGAVPLDLLKEEQSRIADDMARLGAELASTEVDWSLVRQRMCAAVGLVAQLYDLYIEAAPRERQRINQAVWQRIEVDVEGVAGAVPTDPMAALITEDLVRVVGAENENREHLEGARGSRLDVLVEAKGLEPSNLLTARGLLAVHCRSVRSADTPVTWGVSMRSFGPVQLGSGPWLHFWLHYWQSSAVSS